MTRNGQTTAHTTVQSLTIDPRPRAGRPKDEPRQAAIALASLLAQAVERMVPESQHTSRGVLRGRRRLTQKKGELRDPLFPFALETERSVRRIETDARNPANTLPGPTVTVTMRPAADASGSIARIGAATITVTDIEVHITGDGWLWTTGTQAATYGTIHATADLTADFSHQMVINHA
jgi:hypothetical protein